MVVKLIEGTLRKLERDIESSLRQAQAPLEITDMHSQTFIVESKQAH